MRVGKLAGTLAASLALAGAAVAGPGEFKTYTVDIGTGLAVYMEFPVAGRDRPVRVVYDTGKGRGKGADNDLVSFLSSPEIGLKIAATAAQNTGDRDSVADESMPDGDVIDYFLLSHPHEDHFNGAKAMFDRFDVSTCATSSSRSRSTRPAT
jgi:beta-lactamase superfamily II metal-dependent hydrolase